MAILWVMVGAAIGVIAAGILGANGHEDVLATEQVYERQLEESNMKRYYWRQLAQERGDKLKKLEARIREEQR